jgi:competence protein ComGC
MFCKKYDNNGMTIKTITMMMVMIIIIIIIIIIKLPQLKLIKKLNWTGI